MIENVKLNIIKCYRLERIIAETLRRRDLKIETGNNKIICNKNL
jgi:hypothetical protein